MRITVAGTGYVGLVAGICFAELGNEVTCCDVDAEKVARLNRGDVPCYELGLQALLRRNLGDQRISFSLDLGAAVSGADVVFIAVGTPAAPNGEAEISQVLATAAEIGRNLRGPAIVAIKSTVPVGTADKVKAVIAKETSHPFSVVSNPEFLKEGDAVNDFLKPSRVIIGSDDESARAVMRRLYEPFVHSHERILFMDNRSAELTKYAANAMLATRISFMNEIAALCEQVGADVHFVRHGVGTDPRIGTKFLFPGPGFGGSCFPKDLRALSALSKAAGVPLDLVDATLKINERQKVAVAQKVIKHFGGSLIGLRLAVWGLSYKPNTDDVRESPALVMIEALLEAGAKVVARDPAATESTRKVLADRIAYADNDYQVAEGADALILMTEWREFRNPDFTRLKSIMARPILFDGRNVWDPDHVRELGFTYYGVGRPQEPSKNGPPG